MEKPSVTKKRIFQTIDLEELTGVDLSEARSLKEVIGQELLDLIDKRTADGIGLNGIKLRSPYSKVYRESLAFKAAGKSPSEITMKLTGDMLASVDLETSPKDSKLTIFIEEDQTLKAYNHLTGDTVPKRNWFGVSKKEVTGVLSKYKDEIKAALADEGETDLGNTATIRALDLVRSGELDFFGEDD